MFFMLSGGSKVWQKSKDGMVLIDLVMDILLEKGENCNTEWSPQPGRWHLSKYFWDSKGKWDTQQNDTCSWKKEKLSQQYKDCCPHSLRHIIVFTECIDMVLYLGLLKLYIF